MYISKCLSASVNSNDIPWAGNAEMLRPHAYYVCIWGWTWRLWLTMCNLSTLLSLCMSHLFKEGELFRPLCKISFVWGHVPEFLSNMVFILKNAQCAKAYALLICSHQIYSREFISFVIFFSFGQIKLRHVIYIRMTYTTKFSSFFNLYCFVMQCCHLVATWSILKHSIPDS